jgi:hypothetical protein
MSVDILASTISLQNVILAPEQETLAALIKNAQAPNDVFKISFKSFVIEGINLDDALTSKTMDYSLLKLVNPHIEIHHKKRKEKAKKEEGFSDLFLKEMEKFSLKKLVIEGATVVHYNDDKNAKQTKLNEFSLVMNDVLIDSVTRNDKARFLFAKEAFISFKNFIATTTDGLYDMKIGMVTVKAPQQTVSLQNLSFKSKFSKAALQKKFKTRKEIFDLSVPSITIKNMDWWDVLNEERLEAGDVTIANLKLAVYLDRSFPAASKMGNFPNQLIMKMPMKIDLSKIRVKNMEVAYTELNPKSAQTGTVVLDKIDMEINGVTNMPEKLPKGKKITITASAHFMRTVPLKASFSLDMMNYKKGVFSADLSLDGFDGQLVNSFAAPLGLVSVKNGSLQNITIKVTGNETKAKSDVLVLYKDIKVSLLEKESGKKALDKKDVTSFLANLFVLKADNPKGSKEPRREMGEFIRNTNAGFLNLVWKTSLVGILKTIGAPAKLAYKQ